MKSAVVIYCVRYKEGDWPDSMDITPDEWQYMKETSDVLAGCYLAVQTLQTSNDAWVSSTLLVIDNLLVSLRILGTEPDPTRWPGGNRVGSGNPTRPGFFRVVFRVARISAT
jgi:hypothetical protein